MFANNDELDEDIEDTEDADLEDENSDDDLEDEELDDDKGGDDDDEDDDELSEEESKKPVTKGELREFMKAQRIAAKAAAKKGANNSNAARRVASKKGDPLQTKTPKVNERLANIEANQAKLDLIETKRQFAYENSLSPKETDLVFRLTKRPTAKFLKQPYVQAALGAIRSSNNVRNNTPGSGGRPVFKVGDKDFKDLPADQKQANFTERRRSILEAQKNR